MRLIVHHVLKDLRAVRWLVAAWAAALVTVACADVLVPSIPGLLQESLGRRPDLSPAAMLLFAIASARVVLTWVITARIVHTDPLDSTEAFWLTRPLTPASLLAAKGGLVALLFVVVPSIAAALVMLAGGAAPLALPALLARWIVPDLAFVSWVLLLASLTRDLARTVLTQMAAFACWVVLHLLATGVYEQGFHGDNPFGTVTPRAWLGALAVFGAVAIGVTVVHYLTRRRRLALLLSNAAVLACLAVAWFWPVQVTMAASERLRHARSWMGTYDKGAQVALSVDPASLRAAYTGTSTMDFVVGDIQASNVEDGVVLDTAVDSNATFTVAGTALAIRHINWRSWSPYADAAPFRENRRVVEYALGARFIGDPAWETIHGTRDGAELVSLAGPTYRRYQGIPGRYDAQIGLVAKRVSVAAVLPLRVGASARIGDLHAAIERIGGERLAAWPDKADFTLVLREWTPSSLGAGGAAIPQCALRNRKRGEAVTLVYTGTAYWALRPAQMAVFCAHFSRSELVHPTQPGAPPPAGLNAAWLADAELVFLRFETLGRFTRPLTIEGFTLPEVYVPGAPPSDR